MGAQLAISFFSVPSSLLILFLLPLFPRLLPVTAKESGERLSSLAGPGV